MFKLLDQLQIISQFDNTKQRMHIYIIFIISIFQFALSINSQCFVHHFEPDDGTVI